MADNGSNPTYTRKKFHEVLQKGLKYVEKRKTGVIRSLKTPWPSFNQAGINGLEWGSMLTLGARPGAGKTMLVSQLLRDANILNPNMEFNILEFQFEMGDEQYATRQFAGHTTVEYGKLLSTKRPVEESTINRLKQYIQDCEEMDKKGIIREMITDPLDADEIEQAIKQAYLDWGQKPIIVTIDHSWLIKKRKDEREKLQTLYNTAEMLMKLKNKIPIIVIMITQLNRSIDEASRKEPGKIGNYPTSADIFGGDAFMQASDMVAIINNPQKAGITSYGPEKYISGDDDVYMHIIKSRNNGNKIELLFLKMIGNAQRMVEVTSPNIDVSLTTFTPLSQRSKAIDPALQKTRRAVLDSDYPD